jgi:phenylalanyl-tRNA synthetase beta chain
MKVPLEWLKDFVEVRLRPEELAERLTMAGLEVGAIEYHGKGIEGVVVGKVKSVEKLPSDHHLICQIDTGQRLVRVITEDASLKMGEKVPLAQVGAQIAGGIEIKKTELHGVEAFGYLCRPHELGLYEEKYVLRLPLDAKLGEDVRKYIGLGGCVLDVDVLPNRGDCLSVVGVAREVSAVTNTKLKKPATKVAVKFKRDFSLSLRKISIEVKDKDLCPRYMARMIEGVTIKESPEWLKNRLLLAGLRPINCVVDATNYLLIERGQPLHAFDAEKLSGAKIIVRRAKEGEKIITLDGVGRKLEKEMLVIADSERAVALAGVMGGAETSVSSSTTTILLESAYFNPASINRTSKKVKLRSESSIRFEKGVDWEMAEGALDRAAQMIAEISGGKVTNYKVDIKAKERKPKILELRQERLDRILGIHVSLREASKLLEKLGFRKLKVDSRKLKVGIPLWRAGDLEREIDLIEEVARLHGYEKIRTTVPMVREETLQENRNYLLTRKIREILIGCGLDEAQTFSLVDPKMAGEDALQLKNPMTPEESVLRSDLLPGLLKAVSRNLRHQIDEVKLFEIGYVFIKGESKLPQEKLKAAGALTGKGEDFYRVKNIVENLLSEFPAIWKLQATTNDKLHPGQSAAILFGPKQKVLGQFGKLHPELKRRWDLRPEVFVFDIDLEVLREHLGTVRRYRALPRFPRVDRDLAMFVPEGVTAQAIADLIRRVGGELLEEVFLFDQYKNSQAYRLSFRDPHQTLTDEIVSPLFDKIQEALTSDLKVQIRK